MELTFSYGELWGDPVTMDLGADLSYLAPARGIMPGGWLANR
jgi:hypothetical protein